LRMTASGSGSTTPAEGIHTYSIEELVDITATPETNWEFVDWIGDVDNNNLASTNVTMNWDKTVTANFTRVASILIMAVNGSGSTTPAVGSHTYPIGELVDITATPASGWQFSSWTGSVANANSASTNVTMDTDRTVTANFSQIQTSPPSGGGGGGGGGGLAGLTSLSPVTTMEGKLFEDVTAISEDKKLSLFLPKGTITRNRVGSLLPNILIQEEKEPPAPPLDSQVIGLVYDIYPDGATFDPPITLTLGYDASGLPQGVDEGNLVIAMWKKSNGQWVELESTVDPENDVISTKVAHLCNFTIVTGTRPAEFKISNLSVTPSEIYPGENANISIMVTNIGDLTGSYEAILKINDEVKETRGMTIAGGDNVTADFIVTGKTIGKYNIEIGGLEATFDVVPTPADFIVSSLSIFPDEVPPGENVNIAVTVINASESEGSYEVILKINGTIVDIKEVLLAGRTSKEVVFTTVLDTPGKK